MKGPAAPELVPGRKASYVGGRRSAARVKIIRGQGGEDASARRPWGPRKLGSLGSIDDLLVSDDHHGIAAAQAVNLPAGVGRAGGDAEVRIEMTELVAVEGDVGRTEHAPLGGLDEDRATLLVDELEVVQRFEDAGKSMLARDPHAHRRLAADRLAEVLATAHPSDSRDHRVVGRVLQRGPIVGGDLVGLSPQEALHSIGSSPSGSSVGFPEPSSRPGRPR